MRTGNPVLSEKIFQNTRSRAAGETMTAQGAAMKTGVLLLLCVLSASWTWSMVLDAARGIGSAGNVSAWMMGGLIGGLVLALVTIFKKEWAKITAPLYALAEGLLLGGLSAYLEQMYPGIAIQAVGLTFGVLLVMLVAYQAGWIKVTQKFRSGLMMAMGAVFLIYMVSFVLGFFGVNIPYIHDSGPIGILFSLAVVVIASLTLLLDFDFIQKGEENGLPKYMEWFAAFGLMVTLVWLYIEILRLLSKLRE
jgi:uncharacterized YccA/Bax inhibitor family protein